MSGLHDLAAAAGLSVEWEDAAGRPQTVSDANLARVLAALGFAADSDDAIAASLAKCRAADAECSFVSAVADTAFGLPAGCGEAAETAELELEDGTRRTVPISAGEGGLCVPAIDAIGYHTLHLGNRAIRLAIAPERCLGIGDLAPGQRLWGPAVQVPALRNGDGRAFGDFGTLADAARRFAAAGAGALAISPTHALFPADAARFSPYAPSSRLYLNVLFADPALVDAPIPAGDDPGLIDWEQAIPARMAALRAAYDERGPEVEAKVAAFRASGGDELERHATFDALHAHFFAAGARGWQDWPVEFHDAGGDAVARFASDHRDAVDFYLFAQWLARASLEAAQAAAKDGGMAVGLIADLAVGMDGGGSHAWSRRDELLTGLSVGAPPDLLGPDGQDWGLTTFSPAALQRTGFDAFIATIRAALGPAGGIRIDHALGLNRLWVVPHGGSPADGAYLAYPLDDMLRILAIESHRGGAIVIGEDLGTVPEGLRPKLEAAQVLGMRVLPFERDEDGAYVPPAQWQRQAVAMTGTHDLPTIAGWWQGRDIDWTWALGRTSGNDTEQEDRHDRAAERAPMWDALVASGASAGIMPDVDEPGPVLDAALTHVGGTPCDLAIVPLEDIVGLVEQPNLPGTTDEHPNWRRRMPAPTADLLARPAVARRVAHLARARSGKTAT